MDSCGNTALTAQARALVPVLIEAGQKKPVEYQWQDKRYTRNQLRQRYDNNPNLNVGVLLGPNGDVIDIECDCPEAVTHKSELFAGCEKPKTPSYTSRRGGHELYRWHPRLAEICKAKFNWKTVEIRLGAGDKAAQSLLPPSVTDGFQRDWIHGLDTPLADLPELVVDRLIEAARPEPKSDLPTVKDSLEDDFCRRGDWRQILEPHGWTYCGKSDDKDTFRRPGKSEGISADIVIANDGRELLHCFTTNAPPFEPGNYNKLAAFTLLNHNGDKAAARSELRKQGFGSRFVISLITSAQLAAGNFKVEYLVENAMVACQPMIVAGSKKTLKTSIMVDLAISLAMKRLFLGHFKVNRACRVLMLTGESGMGTIQETAERIADSKEVKLQNIDGLLWSETLPKFDNREHLEGLNDAIRESGCEVVIIDPAYLCMPGTDAGNLFVQGRLLGDVAEICRNNKVAMVLAHHTRKGDRGRAKFPTAQLDDIAWSGFAEFARQWLLLSRREEFIPGTGEHKLWLSIGGSAGHSDLVGLDVNEGHKGTKPRLWNVAVTDAEQAFGERQQEKRQAKADDRLARLVAAAKKRPDSLRELCKAAKLTRNKQITALAKGAVASGYLAETKVTKNNRLIDAYRVGETPLSTSA